MLTLALSVAGCAVERTRGLDRAPTAEVALTVAEDGPWKEVAEAAPVAEATPEEAGLPPEVAQALASTSVPGPIPSAAPAAPRLAAPVRRATPPPSPRGTAPGRSPADLARERYLVNPTRIQAQKISFRCPARFAGEIRRTADAVATEAPGKVVLSGRARLTCRELTLEADRILLEVLAPGVEDLHVAAKGNASFVTVQRDQVLRQEGARSILVTNDRVIPLR